jgi:mono/diheme cytochrome c family protein
MRIRPLLLLCLVLPILACETVPAGAPAASAPAARDASSGQAFAQATCGGCHAIGGSGYSSNSNAPPFREIVNREGLTGETLATWLRGAHNYPSEMDFFLNDAQVNQLAAYMLTLRERDYRPPRD